MTDLTDQSSCTLDTSESNTARYGMLVAVSGRIDAAECPPQSPSNQVLDDLIGSWGWPTAVLRHRSAFENREARQLQVKSFFAILHLTDITHLDADSVRRIATDHALNVVAMTFRSGTDEVSRGRDEAVLSRMAGL